MTAYQILLHELAAHGRTTYAELCARYPGWSYESFKTAAGRARRAGVVQVIGKGRVIILAAGPCPCCGQALMQSVVQRERIAELLIRALRLEVALQEVEV